MAVQVTTYALLISNNAGNVDAKDESSCSQAIRTRRFTTLLTGVMCATRTNTLILGQSLSIRMKYLMHIWFAMKI
jgi:hypothetical protein